MTQPSAPPHVPAAARELPVMIGLLLVFAIAAIWIIGRLQTDYEDYPAYSTHSPKPEGARALYLLSRESGLEAGQFYESEYDYPQSAAMVVLHEEGMDSAAWIFDPYDISAVLDWVAEGNCLVLGAPSRGLLADALEEELGALAYGSYVADPRVVGQYTQAGQTGKVQAFWRVFQPGQQYGFPQGRPDLWQGVQQIEAAGGFGASYIKDAAVLLAVSDPPEPVVLQLSHGQGELLWLLRPEMLANTWLNRMDNAEVGYALLSYAGRYGPLYFDENIHGYSRPQKNALQLILTTKGGWLLLAGLLSILLMLSGRAVLPARFVVRPVQQRRDSAEMVLAQADLYRRAKVTGLLSRGLLDSYRRKLQRLTNAGAPLDEASFRDHLSRLREGSGGGRALLTKYLEGGQLPHRPNELLAFAQELGSLLEAARRTYGSAGPRRRLQ